MSLMDYSEYNWQTIDGDFKSPSGLIPDVYKTWLYIRDTTVPKVKDVNGNDYYSQLIGKVEYGRVSFRDLYIEAVQIDYAVIAVAWYYEQSESGTFGKIHGWIGVGKYTGNSEYSMRDWAIDRVKELVPKMKHVPHEIVEFAKNIKD